MATGPDRVHVVVSGVLGTEEEFAFGFNVEPILSDQAELDGITDSVAAYLIGTTGDAPALRALLGADSRFTAVRAYLYFSSSSSAVLMAEATINLAGTGTGGHPKQVSLVATLRSAVPSRRARGRLFLPAAGAALNASGFLSSPTPAAVAGAVAGLLHSAEASDRVAIVVSFAGQATYPVIQVTVDNKMDVQRRRADSIAATATGTAAV